MIKKTDAALPPPPSPPPYLYRAMVTMVVGGFYL